MLHTRTGLLFSEHLATCNDLGMPRSIIARVGGSCLENLFKGFT
jgi:hypothetical protein